MEKGWDVYDNRDQVEVVPRNDLKPHSRPCKCEPRVEEREGKRPLIIHNSWDGREFFEVPNEHSC